jgi:hypothetical protein
LLLFFFEELDAEVVEVATGSVSVRERQGVMVRSVGKEDKYAFFYRIDPQACARKSKMAKAFRLHPFSGG